MGRFPPSSLASAGAICLPPWVVLLFLPLVASIRRSAVLRVWWYFRVLAPFDALVRLLCFFQALMFFSRLFMAGNIRDGTGRYCFDMFGGEKVEGGTGRDGKMMKIILACWMGREGTVGVNFLDGTGRYSATGDILSTGRDVTI